MNVVKYIPYKGEELPVRISYYAITRFQDETKVDISELGTHFKYIEVLLWYSLVAGHNAANKELTFKREDIPFLLDESMDKWNVILADSTPAPSGDNTPSKKK